jgi:hypothetical protein
VIADFSLALFPFSTAGVEGGRAKKKLNRKDGKTQSLIQSVHHAQI